MERDDDPLIIIPSDNEDDPDIKVEVSIKREIDLSQDSGDEDDVEFLGSARGFMFSQTQGKRAAARRERRRARRRVRKQAEESASQAGAENVGAGENNNKDPPAPAQCSSNMCSTNGDTRIGPVISSTSTAATASSSHAVSAGVGPTTSSSGAETMGYNVFSQDQCRSTASISTTTTLSQSCPETKQISERITVDPGAPIEIVLKNTDTVIQIQMAGPVSTDTTSTVLKKKMPPPPPPPRISAPVCPPKTAVVQTGPSLLNGEEIPRENIDLATSSSINPDHHRSRHCSESTRRRSRSRHRHRSSSTSRRSRSRSYHRSRRSRSRSHTGNRDEHRSNRRSDRRHSTEDRSTRSVSHSHVSSRPKFSTPKTLIQIMKKCKQCGEKSNARSAAVQHQKRKHRKKFCPVCFKLLSTKGNDWKNHFLRNHAIGDSESAKCHFCDRVFNIDGMYFHVSMQHLRPQERASECESDGVSEENGDGEKEKEDTPPPVLLPNLPRTPTNANATTTSQQNRAHVSPREIRALNRNRNLERRTEETVLRIISASCRDSPHPQSGSTNTNTAASTRLMNEESDQNPVPTGSSNDSASTGARVVIEPLPPNIATTSTGGSGETAGCSQDRPVTNDSAIKKMLYKFIRNNKNGMHPERHEIEKIAKKFNKDFALMKDLVLDVYRQICKEKRGK